MKKIITSDMYAEDEIIVECECLCGFLAIHKFKRNPRYFQFDDSYNIRYYSSRNLKKRDEYAWDICINRQQFETLLDSLNKLKEA